MLQDLMVTWVPWALSQIKIAHQQKIVRLQEEIHSVTDIMKRLHVSDDEIAAVHNFLKNK